MTCSLSCVTTTAATSTASEPTKTEKPTSPAAELRRGEWKEHLTKALDTLELEVARYKPSEREGMQMAIAARLLHLIANHRDKAVAAMDQLQLDVLA